jgi:hypothetical protein
MKKINSLLTALFLVYHLVVMMNQLQVLRLFGCYVNGIKRGSNKQLYCYGYRNTQI